MLKRRRGSLFVRIFEPSMVIVSIVSLIIAMIAGTEKGMLTTERKYASERELEDIRIYLKGLEQRIDRIVASDSQINDSGITFKFQNMYAELNSKMNKLSEQTLGIRQAISPLKPDEVLTIARLREAIDLVNKNQSRLESDLNQKMEDFKSSVLREIGSMSKTFTWLFVVLIPLVLNLIYTMWKDRRESKSKPQQPTPSE